MRNLEIKIGVTVSQCESLERKVRAAGMPVMELAQVDTYFIAGHGRLKLRETTNEAGVRTAELIAYRRPNLSGPRWSDYDLLPLDPEVAARLRSMLAQTLGIVTTVSKRRLVAMRSRSRSRIHLDRVDGLGCFLEIETVVLGDNEPGVDRELRATLEWLGVDLATVDPIQGSYADLLHARERSGEGVGFENRDRVADR